MTSIGFDPYPGEEEDERNLEAEWAYFGEGNHEYEDEALGGSVRHESHPVEDDGYQQLN